MTSEGHLLCGKKKYDCVKLILVQKTTDSLIYSLVSWTSRTQPSIHFLKTIYPFQGHRGVEPLPVKLYVTAGNLPNSIFLPFFFKLLFNAFSILWCNAGFASPHLEYLCSILTIQLCHFAMLSSRTNKTEGS